MPPVQMSSRLVHSTRSQTRRWVPVADLNPFSLNDLHIAARVLGFPDTRTLVDNLLELSALPAEKEK